MAETPPKNIQIIPPGVRRWDGPPVLNVHGCALLERFSGKSYCYRAVNYATGASAHICRRTKPLTEADFGKVSELIRVSQAAFGPNYLTEVRRDERLSHDKLSEILKHIFETLMPLHGYNLRKEQAELAEQILDALCGRAVSLSEAGVGIGKTHAYLIAAALVRRSRVIDFWIRGNYPKLSFISDMPIVVATSSIALQKAIAKDYIPAISRILEKHGVITKPLSCVIRKGKEHYVCGKRLRAFYNRGADAKERRLLSPMVRGKGGIDLDEMDFLKPYVKRRINVDGCRGRYCEKYNECRYIRFMKDAQSDKHDFQICNHNYLLADTLRRSKGEAPLIPHYQALIIDEAHKFTQAARQMYGTELSSLTLPELAKTVRGFVFQQGQSTAELWRDCDKLDGQAKRLFRVLVDNVPDTYDDEAERIKTAICGKAMRHLRNISVILERIEALLSERDVLPKYANPYRQTMWTLEKLREQIARFIDHDDLIYWLEAPEGLFKPDRDDSDETLLCAIPKRLGEMLHADLWGKGIPTILTSGTLSASGDFTHVKNSLGLNLLPPSVIMETSKPSPYDYRENAMIYISENVPFPDNDNPEYIAAVADEVERLITAAHGHTAVLFTSYRVMELVFGILKKRGLSQSGSIPFPLFLMKRGDNNAIARFRESGNGVLFAAGNMWEGIDLPGDILSMLIIVKLPFSVPDPIISHERTMYSSAGKFKNAVIIPEMLVKLMQGFGRLIRSMSDTGIVAILDSRVRKGAPYRNRILNALPFCRVTSLIADVRDFILSG